MEAYNNNSSYGRGRSKDKKSGSADKKGKVLQMRKKTCRFCAAQAPLIDYKEVKLLEKFVSERGKILSRRLTGNCAKHQRAVCSAVNRARFLALMPHVKSYTLI